jgi:hypothetical protein
VNADAMARIHKIPYSLVSNVDGFSIKTELTQLNPLLQGMISCVHLLLTRQYGRENDGGGLMKAELGKLSWYSIAMNPFVHASYK